MPSFVCWKPGVRTKWVMSVKVFEEWKSTVEATGIVSIV